MSQPSYRVLVSFDAERRVYVARAPELEHCTGEGATRADALTRVEEEIEAQIQNIHAHGASPPAAIDEAEWTGDLALHVSKTLHRDLIWQARREGIELDQICSELLAASLETRRRASAGTRGPRAPGETLAPDGIGNERAREPGNTAGRGRGGFPNRNPALLDDRAHFIEYVRQLDNGGSGGGNPGGSGGHGPTHGGRGPGGGGQGGRRRRRGGGHGPGNGGFRGEAPAGGRGGRPGDGSNGTGGT